MLTAVSPKKTPAPPPDLVQLNIRVPPALLDTFDKIAAEKNVAAGWNKHTRSDVMRDALLAAAAEWEKKKR